MMEHSPECDAISFTDRNARRGDGIAVPKCGNNKVRQPLDCRAFRYIADALLNESKSNLLCTAAGDRISCQ